MKKNKKNNTKNTKASSRKTKKDELKTSRLLATEKNPKDAEPVPSRVEPQSAKAVVFLIGESPLVEQYAELCASHGYFVSISWNEAVIQKSDFNFPDIKVSKTIPPHASLAIELTNTDPLAKKKNIENLAQALPETAPILTSSITISATEQASWISGRHRLVGIAALPTLINKPLVEVAPTIYSPKETLEVVSRFFRTLGKDIEIVQDRIGMVFPRIICQVINEAAFALTEDAAAPADIDRALKLGMQFPLGPIEWAEQIGLQQVYAVLSALHSDLQEERYRVAPVLKQMALTGAWWKQTIIQTNEMNP